MSNELISYYANKLQQLYQDGKTDFDSRHSGVESLMQVVAEAGIEWSLFVQLTDSLNEKNKNGLEKVTDNERLL